MAEDNIIKTTAEAVRGVVEAVPVYQDALQPAAKQVGRSLEVVARAINVALAPLTALVWGYDRISEYLNTRLAELLSHVPEERIITPPPSVAGPLLEGMRFVAADAELREMFARLLATAMDSDSQPRALPAFVEILKQISADEARILRYFERVGFFPAPIITVRLVVQPVKTPAEPAMLIFAPHRTSLTDKAEIAHRQLATVYINNLCRLGVLATDYTARLASSAYADIENEPEIARYKHTEVSPEVRYEILYGQIALTTLGEMLVTACVSSLE
ncbi:MAG: DUF4393 domain-containing protein [Acidobacteriota bacterium]